jgi:hypothetical protein
MPRPPRPRPGQVAELEERLATAQMPATPTPTVHRTPGPTGRDRAGSATPRPRRGSSAHR